MAQRADVRWNRYVADPLANKGALCPMAVCYWYLGLRSLLQGSGLQPRRLPSGAAAKPVAVHKGGRQTSKINVFSVPSTQLRATSPAADGDGQSGTPIPALYRHNRSGASRHGSGGSSSNMTPLRTETVRPQYRPSPRDDEDSWGPSPAATRSPKRHPHPSPTTPVGAPSRQRVRQDDSSNGPLSSGSSNDGSSSGGSSNRLGGRRGPRRLYDGNSPNSRRSYSPGAPSIEPDPAGDEAGPLFGSYSQEPLSYSQRVARLRKPVLTAADKLHLSAEERARIFRALRTPLRGTSAPGGPGQQPQPQQPQPRWPQGPQRPAVSRPPPLRVFCHGIDDVRLYRALEGAGALGRVVVVADVASADAVIATGRKRTGRALVLKEVTNAARKAGKPFVELPAVSSVRLMEAVEALTGWPVPAHLREKTPQPVAFLPPLEGDPSGSEAALGLLSGGRSLTEYLLSRPAHVVPDSITSQLDRTDMYDSRDALLPVNPKEREATRQRPLTRPYMSRSRIVRQQMLEGQRRRRAESSGEVMW